MGNRYLITNQPVSYCGLEIIKTDNRFYVYENKNAFPMAYIRQDTMSERQYSTLNYPDNISALLNYTIIPQDIPDVKFNSEFKPINLSDLFNTAVSEIRNGEKVIDTEKGAAEFSYSMPENASRKILLLRFKVADPKVKGRFSWENKGDIHISINGIRRRVTYRCCWFIKTFSDHITIKFQKQNVT